MNKGMNVAWQVGVVVVAVAVIGWLCPESVLLVLSMGGLALGTLLVPNVGEGLMLELITHKSEPADLVIGLYTNDKTPGEADVLGDYTEMGAVQNYASKTLTGSSWTVTPGAPSEAAYAQQTWTFTAGGPTSVYGYFVKNGTTLMWAERFTGAPFVVQNAGDEIKITPKITLE